MKILCVCSQGNKRSVFTKFLLNHRHDALSCGVETSSPETLKMLCEWADKILTAEPQYAAAIPIEYREKIDGRFTIGEDTYPVSITGTLKDIIYRKLKDLHYL